MTEWFVSSAVLAALVIVLRFALKGRVNPRLQYALWALVLLRLLVPFSVGEAFFSASNLTQQAARTEAGKAVTSFTQRELSFPGDDTTLPEHEYKTLDVPVNTAVAAAPAPAPTVTPARWSVGDIFTALWLLGVVVVGGVLFGSNLHFWIKLRRSRHKLNRPIYPLKVYVSNRLDTPCLFGLFRPSIYITPEAMENETVLRHAVEHELSHFRQGDHLWSLLRGVGLALHWFDPFVWWAAVLSRNDSELACDEATVKRLGEGERAEYGRTLIAMTCQRRPALLTAATTMTGSRSSIKERITTIAKKPKTSALALGLALVVAVLAMGCTFTGAPETPSDDAGVSSSSSEPAPSTAPTSAPSAKPVESEPAGIEPVSSLTEEEILAKEKSDLIKEELHRKLKELMTAGESPKLTLYLEDGTKWESLYIPPYIGERLAVPLAGYSWAEVEGPTNMADDYWLTAVSGDGTKSMTFYQDNGGGIVEYADGETSTWWRATSGGYDDPPFDSIAKDVRLEYDNLEVDYERIAFQIDGTAEDAASYFVNTAYGEHRSSVAPGSSVAMTDFEVIDWGVNEVSEDGKAVICWSKSAFVPVAPDFPLAGNTGIGEGEYEGKLIWSHSFLLQLQEDGYWHCTDFSCGNMTLKTCGLS